MHQLSATECRAVTGELERMQVCLVNIGGGEPAPRTPAPASGENVRPFRRR